MKTLILSIALLSSTLAFSQVGVDTQNPQAKFHVDGAKDNAITGVPTAAQQANDFVVTSAGNVGVGTVAPANKLTVTGGKIQYTDGTQGDGNILVSDANGIATWKAVAVNFNFAPLGPGANIPATTNDYIYTNTFVDLPPGKWIVSPTMLMTKPGNPNTGATETWWLRTTFADNPANTTQATVSSADIISSNTLVSGLLPSSTAFSILNGFVIINNTSGATKRYYYMAGGVASNGGTGSLSGFGGFSWGEDNISFQRIN